MTKARLRTAVLLLVLAACSGDGGTGPGETPGGGGGGGGGGGNSANTITVSGLSFMVKDLTVPVGTKVTWVSESTAPHTITPENTTQPGVWQAVEFAKTGTVLEHTFNTAGQVYRYRCVLHSSNFTTGMVGTVTVK